MKVDLSEPCSHIDQVKVHDVKRPAHVCEDCIKMGGTWVHLRYCLICGHVGCCDSSPHRHATAHYHATKHPIITSAEAGEAWTWCYIDEQVLSSS